MESAEARQSAAGLAGGGGMDKGLSCLDEELRSRIARQKLFFVGTAPLDGAGHINCSPKGGDTFRVLGDREVAYLDLTGSGIETVAHLQENGRIVVMFCAFEGGPRIVRLHGRGEVVYPDSPDYPGLLAAFGSLPGARAVIRIAVTRLSDSCGYSVPRFEYAGPRDTLDQWAEKKGGEGLAAYRESRNARSIDGLAGYRHGGTGGAA